ncbi:MULTISPECIES: arabinan endo-1,5-alpha-L-arabinosidase [unclassified Sphingomonas]|jgi:arabinan endo-1,5-alpha-L-arabinosidase|uniref:arabinan endo-1,5-alpha-L-arabinosidase n=1 Tax=unclassified Sphingomonas TaxID=196159 RepID=UPI000E10408A|nr:arabinan endo-1,5-alpha-L-arabinosidase [Sphingomonas sp. FARSPH]AXJ96357.1 arabinan endo-1,5-alpha-L-arabinosidase [Sphingomonas sp. FARSPH]
MSYQSAASAPSSVFRRGGVCIVLATTLLFGGVAGSAGSAQSGAGASASGYADRVSGEITGVHDPAIIKAADTYYVFSTTRPDDGGQIPIRTSKDLLTWSKAGTVFAALPEWAKRRIPNAKGLWAPDVSFSHGQYRLYYAISSFGSNISAIGLATNPTLDPTAPDYRWTDQGLVIASSRANDYNAIDPNAYTDADGRQWLTFGSFWTGIKMIRLDPETGKAFAEDHEVRSLVRRPTPDAVEAPFLIDHGGYHYLFVSYDFCCRGAESSYYTIVGRSRDVEGPYLDADGKPLMKGFGQVVLHAKLDPSGRWRGPGHVGLLRDGGRDFIAYHAYDAKNKGMPTLRIQPIEWTTDGWPVAR